MKLTTTIFDIEHQNPTKNMLNVLETYLKKNDIADYGDINLLTILESNGLHDCLWSLKTIDLDNQYDPSLVCEMFIKQNAEHLLDIFEQAFPDDKTLRTALKQPLFVDTYKILLSSIQSISKALSADKKEAVKSAETITQTLETLIKLKSHRSIEEERDDRTEKTEKHLVLLKQMTTEATKHLETLKEMTEQAQNDHDEAADDQRIIERAINNLLIDTVIKVESRDPKQYKFQTELMRKLLLL